MDSGDWTATPVSHPAQTQQQQQQQQQRPPSPPYMSANVSGPVDPHEYYSSFSSMASDAASSARVVNRSYDANNTARSYSQSPERVRIRSTNSMLAPTQQKLSSAKSQPVMNARQPGAVKEMAHKFDHDPNGTSVPVRTANEKYRRQLPARNTGQRSPTSPVRSEKMRLQRKPVTLKTPQHAPDTSFESTASFSSEGTMISASGQHTGLTSPGRAQVQRKPLKQPLFGEITPDGQWNGNFDFSAYLPTQNDYFSAARRGSDGDLALGSRRHSQTELFHPGYSASGNALHHRRSRSDLTALKTAQPPPLPLSQKLPPFAPITERSPHSPTAAMPSKIPVRGRQTTASPRSPSSPVTPRSASALPTPTARTKIPKSPGQESGKENAKEAKRYNPPALSQTTQLLSAKVVAPPPKISPPLRSSRPRQPVSSATTAASRARAAGVHNSPNSPSTKRPSEQWLGKPYDAKQERTRRKIPELDQVDFEARRARIQKALSQNLEHAVSLESLKARSRAVSKESDTSAAAPGAEQEKTNIVDEHQTDEFERETADILPEAKSTVMPLSLETSNLSQPAPDEAPLDTACTEATEFTEFEYDGSPSSARTVQQPTAHTSVDSDLPLLSAVAYQPLAKKKLGDVQPPVGVAESQPVSGQSSPSDIEDRWGLKRSLGDHGSIKIMLDDPKLAHLHQSRSVDGQHVGQVAASSAHSNGTNESAGDYEESPIDPAILRNASSSQPHAAQVPSTALAQSNVANDAVLLQVLGTYRDTGIIAPELLDNMEGYTLDLNRLSANGGSDAILIQNLLDSIAAQRILEQGADAVKHSQPTPATPQTPASAIHAAGTAIVYGATDYEATPERRSQDAVLGSDDEDDFAAQIRRADEEWERQHRGDGPMFNDEDGDKPPPPPKDEGYTPHSSIGPDNSNLEAAWSNHRESALKRLDGRTLSSRNVDSVISEEAVIAASTVAPPAHAPPPPPTMLPYGSQDPAQMAGSQEQLNGQSPRMRKAFSGVGTGSSRPSFDSQRQLPPLASQSMSSFTESTKVGSIDTTADKVHTVSPGPEHKRLQKRRNVIRELLDTENTYHQDLKIIEDIYKATVSDIVTPEDRKTLFGNCDEIERFSLQFYDQLRKAVHAIYLPNKSLRWGNRRGSMSTTQSDGTGQNSVSSTEPVDEDKDRTTIIGKVFLDHLSRMEQLYGAYLRNHDAANQRLSALQQSATVKCWLDECHNNASDITSAWDLDSLLVKPTQRVSKYPLILQQLLDTTPVDHPDHENLKAAVKDTIAMLTRINEAKKRSDLVEQMINGKRKDTDVRSGLAKAFGRRTERLKERVGISEAFQDPEFDGLAQSFGGHYIRLQVTMRDFQDYVNQVDKAIHNTNSIAAALELFTDVHQSSLPEIESKWRRYGQTIRELTNYALTVHKSAIQKRVITPLVTLIKLHESPQKAIAKRKKHIIDYAKAKSIEKRGEKPDRKTVEASEMYEALNDQLKIELPRLYELTSQLVIACLRCFIDAHLEWQMTWERKLQPLLAVSDIPKNIQAIVPAFTADYDLVRSRFSEFALCNGSILAETSNFLTGASNSEMDPVKPAPNRITSTGSEAPSIATPGSSKRQSRNYTPEIPAMETPTLPLDTRIRSNSSMSHHAGLTPITPIANLTAANRPWSNSVTTPPTSAYPSRPSTGTHSQSMSNMTSSFGRISIEHSRNRHDSTATYVTAQGELSSETSNQRFSGIFSSALPPADGSDPSQPYARALSPTPMTQAGSDVKVLFVCASLFEFNIDRARKEAGYPYLTYESGEVFDVVAQKGELWLAKNQDDGANNLGWIWEQHFVILQAE